MRLRVMAPTALVLDLADVERLVVHGPDGAHGIRPRRRDMVLPLVPGVLAYTAAAEGWVAVDEGVLVKIGTDVRVLAHRAVAGPLAELQALVVREFRTADAAEARLREALVALESRFLRGVREVGHAG